MTNIENLAMERIEQLVEMAAHHTLKGNEELSDLLLLEASDLALIMDGESRLFCMKYHRYVSDSFGVVFELEHGDTELMFGGV
jgi:hypothetical protein